MFSKSLKDFNEFIQKEVFDFSKIEATKELKYKRKAMKKMDCYERLNDILVDLKNKHKSIIFCAFFYD
jgi:hypothetical protein